MSHVLYSTCPSQGTLRLIGIRLCRLHFSATSFNRFTIRRATSWRCVHHRVVDKGHPRRPAPDRKNVRSSRGYRAPPKCAAFTSLPRIDSIA